MCIFFVISFILFTKSIAFWRHNMNRKQLITFFACMAFFLIGITSGFAIGKLTSTNPSGALAVENEPTPSILNDVYLIKYNDNSIVVFQKSSSNEWIEEKRFPEIDLFALRDEERENLLRGIEVEGKENVAQLIEDITS